MKILVFLAVLCVVVATGCSSCASVSKENKATIASAALQIAYDMGGAELVAKSVNSLVEEGKLTPEAGAQLLNASQKGYDALIERLNSMSSEGDSDSAISLIAAAIEAAYQNGGREALVIAMNERGIAPAYQNAILKGVELGYAEIKKTLEKETSK